jgi:hypothetical protein
MYNKVSFLGLFLAPDIWSLPFYFDPVPLGNVKTTAEKWDPHVILYVQ